MPPKSKSIKRESNDASSHAPIPDVATLYKMLQTMQREQLKLVESVKQLKDSISKQEENVVSDKEIGSTANNQQSIVRWPSYPIELLNKPYPKNYKIPIFVSYDGRKGIVIGHVSKFLDTIGQWRGRNLEMTDPYKWAKSKRIRCQRTRVHGSKGQWHWIGHYVVSKKFYMETTCVSRITLVHRILIWIEI